MTEALRPADRLIIALDFPSAQPALSLVDRLESQCIWFKVGLELFLAEGPPIVTSLRRRGLKVFLDLKLHDIPNTVASAVRSAAALDVSLLTVHGSGGPAMLHAAQEAASHTPSMRLLAVTVLTSMNREQLYATGIPGSAAEQVVRLGHLAGQSGIPGLVCSAEECEVLRMELGADPLLVVPGIRPEIEAFRAAPDDQSRVATPAQAIRQGASMLVVGRPVTRAVDPAEEVHAILKQIEQALQSKSSAGIRSGLQG